MNASVITVADVVVGDSYRFADFFFVLNEFSSTPVSVGYSTGRGSAGGTLEPGDLQPGGGAVTFAPGQTTQTLRLPLPGSAPGEQGEPFCLNLFVPAGFELLLGKSQAITTLANSIVDAQAGWTQFTLTLNPPSTDVNGVARATESGTTPTGTDIPVLANPASLAAGETATALTDGLIGYVPAESGGRLDGVSSGGTGNTSVAALPGNDSLSGGDGYDSLGSGRSRHRPHCRSEKRSLRFRFGSARTSETGRRRWR